jgi:hypothetical protein
MKSFNSISVIFLLQEACDEDCDYWELKIISSLTHNSAAQKSS